MTSTGAPSSQVSFNQSMTTSDGQDRSPFAYTAAPHTSQRDDFNLTTVAGLLKADGVDLVTVFQMLGEAVIAIATIGGNLLVLVAIATVTSLQTVTNYCVASLAAADLLVGLVGIPCVMAANKGLPTNFLGCLAVNSVIIVLTQISIFGLLVIAIERYYAIRYPYDYCRYCTPRLAVIVIVVCWAAGILVGLVPMFGWNRGKMAEFVDGSPCSFVAVIDMAYMVYLNFFCCVLAPLAAMFVVYGYIYSVVRHHIARIAITMPSQAVAMATVQSQDPAVNESPNRHESPVNSNNVAPATRQDQAAVYYSQQNAHHHQQQQQPASEMTGASKKLSWKREIRAAKWFGVVLAVFALCWLPIHIMNSITLFAGRTNLNAVIVAVILSHANSAVNPVLYAYSNAKFLAAFRRILHLPQPTTSSAGAETLTANV